MKHILLFFLLAIFNLTFAQKGQLSEEEVKFVKRYKEAKQDFVNANYDRVAFYYDSISSIRQNLSITTFKMAHASCINLSETYPERSNVYSAKAESIYNQAIKWYGRQFINEWWNSIEVDPEEDEKYFVKVDSQPVYPGGFAAFYQNVANELKYPIEAQQMGIEGKVFIMFMVNKDGSIDAVNAVKGIGAGCEKEAIRAIKSVANFKPGIKDGQPEYVRMILPVNFDLTSTIKSGKKRKNKNR